MVMSTENLYNGVLHKFRNETLLRKKSNPPPSSLQFSPSKRGEKNENRRAFFFFLLFGLSSIFVLNSFLLLFSQNEKETENYRLLLSSILILGIEIWRAKIKEIILFDFRLHFLISFLFPFLISFF